MKSFEKLPKINVLNEFKRYLPLLTAYNSENFHHVNWHTTRRHIFYGSGATIILLFKSIFAIFATWYLIENGVDLRKIVVSLPLIVGLVNTVIAFIAMMVESRTICGTITRIENAVDQREFCCWSIF